VPDIPGTEGSKEGVFYVRPASTADHTDLRRLPSVKLDTECNLQSKGKEQLAHVTVRNATKHIAFFIRVAVTKRRGGAEVAPTFWNENCFSLLPGEEKSVKATFATEDLDGAPPVVRVGGWNIERTECDL